MRQYRTARHPTCGFLSRLQLNPGVSHQLKNRMGEHIPGTATPVAVARGLRNIRKLRRRYWLVSALFVPAIGVLGGVLSALSSPSRFGTTVVVLMLVVGWLWLSNRLELRVGEMCCPRCGEPYFARRWGPFALHGVFLGNCQHCGLRLRADKHPDRDL